MPIKKIRSFTPLFEGEEGEEENYRPLLTYSDLRALIKDVVQETVEEAVQKYFTKVLEEKKAVQEVDLAEKAWLTQKEVCMFFGVSKETVIANLPTVCLVSSKINAICRLPYYLNYYRTKIAIL